MKFVSRCMMRFVFSSFVAAATSAYSADMPPDGAPSAGKPASQNQPPAESIRLFYEAERLESQGRFSDAAASAEECVRLLKAAPKFQDTAEYIDICARQYEFIGRWDDAERMRRQELAWCKQHLPENDWHITSARVALQQLSVFRDLSDSPQTEWKKASLDYQHFSTLYGSARFKEALPIIERIYEFRKRTFGSNSHLTAFAANSLAITLRKIGNDDRASPLLVDAAANLKLTYGETHPHFADVLNNLARLKLERGDFVQAEDLFIQALNARKSSLTTKHPSYSQSLNDLAEVYSQTGDFARAERMLFDASQIRLDALGDSHVMYAQGLLSLALHYMRSGEYARAEKLYDRVDTIYRARYGAEHPYYAYILACYGNCLLMNKDLVRAETLLNQAHTIYKTTYGERSPNRAFSLDCLAILHWLKGDRAQAKVLAREALSLREQYYDGVQTEFPSLWMNLATFHMADAEWDDADNYLAKACDSAKRNLELNAEGQSERHQLNMLLMQRLYLDAYITLAGGAPKFTLDAYRNVLNWKGSISLRRNSLQLFGATQDSAVQRLVESLRSTSSDLSNAISQSANRLQNDADWNRKLNGLITERERLEVELSRISAPYRSKYGARRTTFEQLQASLPSNAIIIDFLEYWKWNRVVGNTSTAHERHLAAFLVRNDRPVAMVDMGLVAPIAEAVASWRSFVNSGRDPATSGELLRKLLWDPLVPYFGDATLVYVSPDGSISGLPFAALPGNKPASYLLEDYTIAVLPIPQQLTYMLRDEVPAATDPSLLVIGDVDFDTASQPTTELTRNDVPTRNSIASNYSAVRGKSATGYLPLHGTSFEATAVGDSFRRAFADAPLLSLTKSQATEEAVRKNAQQFRFLHLATHGFFAPAELRSSVASGGADPRTFGFSEGFARPMQGYPPGLLSGIVLAGANRAEATGRDDGILTALEAGELFLNGVELATLSACETGLGELAGGEGVFGLQRAFQVAGARNVVASLWKVDDEATAALMSLFYENLWQKKQIPLEALRNAQLTILRDPTEIERNATRGPGTAKPLPNGGRVISTKAVKRTDVRHWAAFQLSGAGR